MYLNINSSRYLGLVTTQMSCCFYSVTLLRKPIWSCNSNVFLSLYSKYTKLIGYDWMRTTYIQQKLRNQTFLEMNLLTLRAWFTFKSNPSSKKNGTYHILHLQYQEGLTTETWWWPAHQILRSTNQYLISSYVSFTTSIHLQYLTSSVASSSATSTTAWQFQVNPLQNLIRYPSKMGRSSIFFQPFTTRYVNLFGDMYAVHLSHVSTNNHLTNLPWTSHPFQHDWLEQTSSKTKS